MDVQTCPYCHITVSLTAEGNCPSCRQFVREPAKKETPPVIRPASEEPYRFRETPASGATSMNPYEPPKSVTVARRSEYDRPWNRGLMWILFGFDGRIPRRAYWGASILVTFLFYAAAFALMAAFGGESDAATFGLLLLYVPFLWCTLAIAVKRWHDRDKSGWWFLIGLIPFVGPLWVFVECGCLRGTMGTNYYGPDPT